MLNGYNSILNKQEKNTTLPTGSKLAQYLQGSTSQNFNSKSHSTHQYLTGNDIASSLPTYSLSQLSVSGDITDDAEDGVSAFLNGNYPSTPHSYLENPEDYPEDDDTDQMYYAYQNQPARIWKNRIKNQPNCQFFMNNNLKAELIARQLSLQPSSNDGTYPSTVENYHNVMLMSNSNLIDRNIPNMVYRAIKSTNGNTYCLRQVPTSRFHNQKHLMAVENWKRLSHSNVVQLCEVFQTRAFNDNSYVFVYDFYPLAETMKSHFFGRNAHDNSIMLSKYASSQKFGGLSEQIVWNYIIQLSSAIRYIHSSGLAIRLFDLSRILFCEKSRILIDSCGIADVLNGDNIGKSNTVTQQVLLILVTGKLNAAQPEKLALSMQYVDQHCSLDLKNVIQTMLGAKVNGHKATSINEIMPMIGARFYGHIESLQLKTDYLEDELSKEVENGRLFRILCKLNTVNERLDSNLDVMWSETGDRYFLKLFRDYIFHQVNDNGKAWIDLSHITMCLNKLDAGVDESIQLMSRDGDNVLIVTYAELRKFLENSFNFLTTSQYSMSSHLSQHQASNKVPVSEMTEEISKRKPAHTLLIAENGETSGVKTAK